MNVITALFTFAAAASICTLPRRYAAIPLLLSALYVCRGAVLEIGSLHFTVVHIVVLFGTCRILAKGERLANGRHSIDWFLILWAIVLSATSAFHTSNQWAFRIGMIWTELGTYLLLRTFIQDADDIVRIFKALCVLMLPVALLMLLEKLTGQNYFSAMGGFSEVNIRAGVIRARGPFEHPILAGTVGATCFPMALYLWKKHPMYALSGLSSATGIIVMSTSSGPIMMVLFILLGLMLWIVRNGLRIFRWLFVIALVVLSAAMHDPVYFLMARVDLTGRSQGWFRARLIQSSIEHLNEWWLVGTDYTRHWMPTGIHANQIHTDITNHLLAIGINGGLLLMLLFIMALLAAFRRVGRSIRENPKAPATELFLVWTLGATLFGHVANFSSISLFDHSIVFFYLVLAAIGAIPDRAWQDSWILSRQPTGRAALRQRRGVSGNQLGIARQ